MIRSSRLFALLGLLSVFFTLHVLWSQHHRQPIQESYADVEPLDYDYLPGGRATAAAAAARAFEEEPVSFYDEEDLEQEYFSIDTHNQPEHPLKSPNQDFHYDGVSINEKGLMAFNPALHDRHPVEILLERGRAQAKAIEERIASVKTLEDAVADYEKAWGMKPPKGFDHWFKFTQSTGSVSVPSMFPLAHKPFLQFLSLSPKEIKDRIALGASKKGPFWTFTFVPDGQGDEGTQTDEDGTWEPKDWHTRGRGRVKVGGNLAWKWRCK